jgi:hypothetical protein
LTLSERIRAVHDKIKNIKCPHCNYVTSHMQNVKSVHEKIGVLRCIQFGHASTQKERLEKHVKVVHDKIKDYKCSFCDYAAT